MRFLIMGLPRSRTAWLSVALTYKNSHCLHEPLLGCMSVSELTTKFDDIDADIVGGADTGAVFFLDAIIKEMPFIKIVVIDRKIEDCESSSRRMGFDSVDLRELRLALDEASQRMNTLVVDYDKLSDPSTGRKIWQHCIGGEFPEKRWTDLARFNIQLMTRQFFQELGLQKESIKSLSGQVTWGS